MSFLFCEGGSPLASQPSLFGEFHDAVQKQGGRCPKNDTPASDHTPSRELSSSSTSSCRCCACCCPVYCSCCSCCCCSCSSFSCCYCSPLPSPSPNRVGLPAAVHTRLFEYIVSEGKNESGSSIYNCKNTRKVYAL